MAAISGNKIAPATSSSSATKAPRAAPACARCSRRPPPSWAQARRYRRLITDGRFSGATRGAAIGHVCPEAAAGGVIGIVREGDIIDINIEKGEINLRLPDKEIEARLAAFVPKEKPAEGYLKRYRALVTPASDGAVFKKF